jgi:hypothetical protein
VTPIAQVKQFLRVIAEPVDQDALKQLLLTFEEVQQTIPSANNSDGVEVVES